MVNIQLVLINRDSVDKRVAIAALFIFINLSNLNYFTLSYLNDTIKVT